MKRMNVAEAKSRLSELIDAALQGEDVVISRRNTPVVKLTAVAQPTKGPRFGVLEGRVRMAADFAAPISDFADYMPRRRRRS